ncbi:MAG: hypothetical protein ABIG95_07150, partial [Candidatus Woesearchaeota archaeon]
EQIFSTFEQQQRPELAKPVPSQIQQVIAMPKKTILPVPEDQGTVWQRLTTMTQKEMDQRGYLIKDQEVFNELRSLFIEKRASQAPEKVRDYVDSGHVTETNIVPLITEFAKKGSINPEALNHIVQRLLETGQLTSAKAESIIGQLKANGIITKPQADQIISGLG